ncbi:MAG: Na/Pi cotransporter family protein [Desulfobacterales bacterium]|nr:Na/Pi cotransporter family protein [Desulfobacterales bacterium]
MPYKTIKTAMLIVTVIVCTAHLAFAGGSSTGEISWGMLIIGLLGGLALFIYGMEQMSEGMKKTAGDQMRSILAALTHNQLLGLAVGTFVTMVIQSSSATTVMLVSFVQAGMMNFTQCLGVILGGGIGTTVTAQLIAFKLTDYALLMVFIGAVMRMFGKTDRMRNIGDIILGFGILFYGMKLMSDTMKPLRSYPAFIDVLKGLENPLLGVLVGTVLTALIQSSSAFTGILIVLAQQDLITLEAGIPMIFGANIGTCITAGLASIGTSREAKRVAMAHVIFKIAGVVLFIFWIPAFAELIRTMGAGVSSGTARDIANAHTVFNVSIGFLFLPATTLFNRLITKLLPERPANPAFDIATRHIDDRQIFNPPVAIELARAEISRVALLLGRMQRSIIIPFFSAEERKDEIFPSLSLLDGIEMREAKINYLQEEIKTYLLKVGQQPLSEKQSDEIYGMISIVKDMESLGDLIHRNMVPLIPKKHALETDFSDEGREELMIYHEKVCKQLFLLKEAFTERNPEKAREIMLQERKYLDLESQYRVRHLQRLLHQRDESVETHEVHMELMDLMKQSIVYSSNIAKTFIASTL